MIPIYIGYDPAETVAFHVLAHSIIERATEPVMIIPVGNTVLPHSVWWRPRGEHDSTEFSNARFLVPRLQDYQGWAIFMDCDMLCLADIQELFDQRDPSKAVLVRKHRQAVKVGSTKFLGQAQHAYSRKNWSSLMLINCEHDAWKNIEPNTDEGLFMHRFEFLDSLEIGELRDTWNELVTPLENEYLAGAPIFGRLWHFTMGGPWHGWIKSVAAWEWAVELSAMLRGKNPRAHINAHLASDGITVGGSYHVSATDALAEAEAATIKQTAA